MTRIWDDTQDKFFFNQLERKEWLIILVGLKIKRGEDTKRKIIEWVEKKYPKDFIVELTSYGNPRPGTDDKADAIVVALAGLEILDEKRHESDNGKLA